MRYVKYIGTSHIRRITKNEWAALTPPVENQTLEWNRANGWTIPADTISEAAWPYIEADEELVVIDKDYRGLAGDRDVAEADQVLYPPLTTAEQAEVFPAVALPEGAEPPAADEEPPADQATGAVSVDKE